MFGVSHTTTWIFYANMQWHAVTYNQQMKWIQPACGWDSIKACFQVHEAETTSGHVVALFVNKAFQAIHMKSFVMLLLPIPESKKQRSKSLEDPEPKILTRQQKIMENHGKSVKSQRCHSYPCRHLDRSRGLRCFWLLLHLHRSHCPGGKKFNFKEIAPITACQIMSILIRLLLYKND